MRRLVADDGVAHVVGVATGRDHQLTALKPQETSFLGRMDGRQFLLLDQVFLFLAQRFFLSREFSGNPLL